MEANDKLTQLAVEKEKAKIHSAQKEEQKTKEAEKNSNMLGKVFQALGNTVRFVFAIIGAEYVLRWLPIGTHDWNKFVKPEKLENICKRNSLILKKIDGVKFNPLSNKWKISNDTSINYITKYKKS